MLPALTSTPGNSAGIFAIASRYAASPRMALRPSFGIFAACAARPRQVTTMPPVPLREWMMSPVGRAGSKTKPKMVAPGGLLEHRPRPVRTGFLVRGEQHLPAEIGRRRGLLKGLERGQDHDQPALHVGHPGAVERMGIEPATGLENIVRGVDRVVVPAKEHLFASPAGASGTAAPSRPAGCSRGVGGESRKFRRGKRPGEGRVQDLPHARQARAVTRT